MPKFPPVDPAYAQAMGWSQGDLNRLDNPLAGVSQPGPPQGGGPFGIYQRPKVQGLLALLAAHPEASASLKDSLLQATLAPIQQQQATTQANRQDFGQLATQIASTPGTTPDFLQAALSANYPNIAESKYGQNTLEGLGSSIPGAVGTPPDPLEGDSFAAIDGDVKKWAEGSETQPGGQRYGLHEATQAVIQPLRAQGYDEATLQKVQDYVAQRWQFYQGPERPEGGY